MAKLRPVTADQLEDFTLASPVGRQASDPVDHLMAGFAVTQRGRAFDAKPLGGIGEAQASHMRRQLDRSFLHAAVALVPFSVEGGGRLQARAASDRCIVFWLSLTVRT